VLDELLFPAKLQLGIQGIEQTEDTITIHIRGTKSSAVCPACGTESGRIHSIYQRYPKDVSLVGQVV
jgi:hypothetical protein